MAYALDTQDKEELKILLTPISKSSPSGDDMRYDAVFDGIKNARREEDERLPQGVWKKDIKMADWRKVADLAKGALATRTKDLQLAVWLTEAWILCDGLKGLDKGVKLLNGLVDQFWETIYPGMNDGDLEYRFGVFEWANDSLPARIQRIKISQPDPAIEPDGKNYSLQDWVDANYLETISKRENGALVMDKALQEGRPSLEMVKKSMEHTPDGFYQDLSGAAKAVIESLDHFEEALIAQAADAPSFHKIHSVVESFSTLGDVILAERKEHQDTLKNAEKKAKEQKKADNTPQETPEPQPNGEEPTKEKAYAQLLVIADYLEFLEPQNPAPHLIRRAVEWGGMSSAEFFSELAKAKCDIQALVQILGLDKPKG